MEEKKELIVGSQIKISNQYSTHFNENFNVDGSPSQVDLEAIFNAPQDNIDIIIGYSKYCYRKFGLIMRTINIIRDFGSNGIKLEYPKKSDKIKQCINDYNKRINIKQLIRDFIMELALTGNLACYDRVNRIDIYPINKIKVMPLVVDNKQLIAYKVDDNSFSSDDYGEEYNKAIETAYPQEILKAMKDGNEYAVLNPENAYFAKINCSQYESYGISVILPAFEDLAHKTLLKEAEKSTANEIIDKIMMIQIGDADNKPTKQLIDAYTQLFSGVKGAVRFTVPYYVDAKYVEPETTVFGNEKFLEVDTDILNTLGISLSLLRGTDGSNYADGILNFSGLTKTIENVRDPITEIIYNLYKAELARNGFKPEDAPTVSFEEVVIDKAAKASLVMELFQNAGLPYQILYEENGMDFDQIKLIREQENNDNMDETFKVHSLPFQGGFGDEGGRPQLSDGQRKTDKGQSNNNQPRTGLTNTNRGNTKSSAKSK